MNEIYDHALQQMEQTVHHLASLVPAPVKVPFRDSFIYRYEEKTLHQAIVQKLARLATGLRAARLLCEHGLVQEQAAIHRIIGEIEEDVEFLAIGYVFDLVGDLHKDFLDYFYLEDMVEENEQLRERPMVKRAKIRAWIANSPAGGGNPSDGIAAARRLSRTYSGFVHAASPQVMDMYGGRRPHFYVEGMLGTQIHQDYVHDLRNYFYRGILAFGMAAKAFGEDELMRTIIEFKDEFERAAGMDY